jgi:tetratricopeptide (TPR) repeat protein
MKIRDILIKSFFAAVILAAIFTAHAAAPPRGGDRLRELVVFPEIGFNFNFGRKTEGCYWVINENVPLAENIFRRRVESNQQPEDIKRLLRLGYALDDDDETNEAQSCYLKAEQLCRKKLEVNPQDGLTMIDLGEALHELDKNEEAENFYRRATLVTSNEWRCWVGLGNYLANNYNLLYPRGSRGQELLAAVMSAQDFSGYQPTSEALNRLETEGYEAAHCYEHALAIAPREPELYFQRAGYSTATNIAGCLIRHYRDKEAIDPKAWLLAFFCDQAVANLQQAAELSPKTTNTSA